MRVLVLGASASLRKVDTASVWILSVPLDAALDWLRSVHSARLDWWRQTSGGRGWPHGASLRAVPRLPFINTPAAITQVWPAHSPAAQVATEPRTDVLQEQPEADGSFSQKVGPFYRYRRELVTGDDGAVTETTTYRLRIPWFGWLFALPIRRALRHRRSAGTTRPWWAPPDLLDERQIRTLALLAVAASSAAFANTLFTQTANFAADSFDIITHPHQRALQIFAHRRVVFGKEDPDHGHHLCRERAAFTSDSMRSNIAVLFWHG